MITDKVYKREILKIFKEDFKRSKASVGSR